MARNGEKNKIDLTEIVRRIEELRIDNDDGSVSFDASGHHDLDHLTVVLQSALEFDPSVSSYERWSIISRARFAAAAAGKLTVKRLKEHVHRLENEFLSAQPMPYVVATTLTFLHIPGLRPITLDGVAIRFSE